MNIGIHILTEIGIDIKFYTYNIECGGVPYKVCTPPIVNPNYYEFHYLYKEITGHLEDYFIHTHINECYKYKHFYEASIRVRKIIDIKYRNIYPYKNIS